MQDNFKREYQRFTEYISSMFNRLYKEDNPTQENTIPEVNININIQLESGKVR